MNVHTESALRSLDAAAAPLTEPERHRATIALERIVTTAAPTGAPQPGTLTPARSRHRLILVPAAALVLTVALVVVQSVRADDQAYASWTAVPATVAGHDLDAVAAACKDKLRGSDIDLDRAGLVLAERRGDHVALLFRTDDPDMSAVCLARNPRGSTEVDGVDTAVGGSSGPALQAPPESYTQGTIAQLDGASVTDGAVGDEVRGVTIHAGTLTVEASVQNGRYAAWWPGDAFKSGALPQSGAGNPELILTYDLILRDGAVIHDAQPTRPS
jgi:hypothetical protein